MWAYFSLSLWSTCKQRGSQSTIYDVKIIPINPVSYLEGSSRPLKNGSIKKLLPNTKQISGFCCDTSAQRHKLYYHKGRTHNIFAILNSYLHQRRREDSWCVLVGMSACEQNNLKV